ncbi:MAG: hypothetical protein B6242_06440 [Anaerolineaceae bacterium 4572_78]|nr:MAG: hypothetical protein B6242_06440 [Anaerolineaceae bacterium 4572_78]
MLKPLQLDESALWKKRFQLPIMYGATISKKNPELGVVISNQSCETPHVYYFEDQKGNELGHFFRVPYEGGDPENITPNLSLYAVRGFHFSHDSSTIAINAIYEKHFHLYCIAVKQDGSLDEPRLIHRTEYETWECMLSYDGKLMAVISTERAKGLRHHSILVFDTQSNERVGELWDGEQNSVMPCMFSPIPDDNRILGITTQTSFERPLVWNPYTNERFEFTLPDMSGDVTPCDWSEDGKRVLLSNMNEAQQQLYIYNLSENCLHVLDHPSGVYDDSNFAGNGEIMTHWQNSITPMQVVMLHEKTGYKTRTLLASGETMPGHALRSITYN